MLMSIFRFLRIALPGLALLSVGCAHQPQVPDAVDANVQGPARVQAPDTSRSTRLMTQVMQAEFARQRGDSRVASEAWARAASHSDDPGVAEAMTAAAIDAGQADTAQAGIERMRDTGADEREVTRERARLALLRGHRDEAREQLVTLLGDGSATAWHDVARVLADARDPALAGVLLESLATETRLPADDASVWLAMSQLGEHLQRHLYAERLAVVAAERFGTARAFAWAAHLKSEAGHDQAALDMLARAVTAEPDSTRYRLTYASALGEDGQNRKALDVLAEADATVGVLAARAAYAARLHDDQALQAVYHDLQAGRAQFERDVSFLLGRLAEVLGKPEAAIGFYADVPVTDENAYDAAVRRAVLLAFSGRSVAAHRLIRGWQQRSTEDSARLHELYLLDAQLYVRAGNGDEAATAYARGLEVFPEDADLLYGRALVAADSGRIDAAIADLRRVLTLDPDNIDAMNALGYTLADDNRDLDEATRLLRRALESQPGEPAIIDSWGWLQYRLGHLDKAETMLRKAWDAVHDPEIGLHLGEVLWQQGKKAEARTIFDAVRELDVDPAVVDAVLQRLQ